MFCPDKSACSIWLNSVTVSWGTVTWPVDRVTLISSLISFCDYFLLLCALVSIIQKEIFSSSIQSVIKCWCRVFCGSFFLFQFKLPFSFSFARSRVKMCNGPDSFPVPPLGVCLLIECGSFFTYCNSYCFFSPHIHTSFHPLNISATPITHF